MHSKISAFFETAIAAAIAPNYLKLENVEYTPQEGQSWAKYNYMPTSTRSTAIGSRQISYRGFIQVDAKVQSNTGPGAVEALLSPLEAAFPIGSQFDIDGSQLSIDSVSRGISSSDPLWYTVPLTVFWSLRKQQ